MCGIFGVIAVSSGKKKPDLVAKSLETLGRYSIARGKDSSGITYKIKSSADYQVVKGDISILKLLKSAENKKILTLAKEELLKGGGFQAMGHARLVTNGSQLEQENNQPVVKDGIIVIHNGIIVNVDYLWMKYPELKRSFKIDTEILPALISLKLKAGSSLEEAIRHATSEIEGTVSSVLFFDDRDEIALVTNNGSLYFYLTPEYLLFASEEYFLRDLLTKIPYENGEIRQLQSFTGMLVNATTLESSHFQLKEAQKSIKQSSKHPKYNIHITNIKGDVNLEKVIDPAIFIDKSKEQNLFKLLQYNSDAINALRRCSRCILPETFPFIKFNEAGICNYCLNYKVKKSKKSLDELRSLVEPYRKNNGKPDCIVPFSGGRDSTYALHIVKKELGLNPIAFTYDWGMVTDLARRNIARVCGKLGVENIIVSADLQWKRENIKKNITAWLENPSLGMIPIFMAGDKYFYYYANRVKERNGIALNLFGMNDLENTDFKIGFAGIAPNFDKERIYSLSLSQKIKLFKYVGSQYLHSPKYFNQSILDTLGSFFARYLTSKKDYYHLFDYLEWDEKSVDDILLNEYNWEKAIDTNTTWRIGDGTASFYNYIYYTVAGFSEFDTFRSNQIREGMIDRATALEIVKKENFPRYETMRWYLEILRLDYWSVISKINSIPKLYQNT